MQKHLVQSIVIILIGLLPSVLHAGTDKYRCMWRDNPSETMVIGWNQVSGESPVLYYDIFDCGQAVYEYRFSQSPDRTVADKGMNNHFVRLEGLSPNTTYYFIIEDSEGVSRRMSFRTAPASPNERLSIIAGGDSRNHREARQAANYMVSRLMPHAVTFAGDMTGGDNDGQWKAWMDDWQLTINAQGMMTPIIVARGNHELSNEVLVNLFDIPSDKAYYSLNLGGKLMNIITLNSMMSTTGLQKEWLTRELSRSQDYIWRFAQYHHSIRPHTKLKSPRKDMWEHWASLFHDFQVQVVLESDAHVVKNTHPIRPGSGPESDEGFIRDDQSGTVYIGEGCWGAPLRQANNAKKWTRGMGSFNQFKLLFVDKDQIVIYTVKTDNSYDVEAVDIRNRFALPKGIQLWKMDGIDNSYVIPRQREQKEPLPTLASTTEVTEGKFRIDSLVAKAIGNSVQISWRSINEPDNIAFELQYKVGNREYQAFDLVKGDGPSSDVLFYSFIDDRNLIQTAEKVNYKVIPLLSPDYPLSAFDTEPDSAPPSRSNKERHNPQKRKPEKEKPAPPKSLFCHPQTGIVEFKYSIQQDMNIKIRLLSDNRRIVKSVDFPNQPKGTYLEKINLKNMDNGRYMLLIEGNKSLIEKYFVIKK